MISGLLISECGEDLASSAGVEHYIDGGVRELWIVFIGVVSK
jgi:hypothetical protein